MSVSVTSNLTATEEKMSILQCPLVRTASIGQQGCEIERKRHLRPDSSIHVGDEHPLGDGHFQVKDHLDKIEFTGFFFDKPWLPSDALKVLKKLRRGPVSETELVKLMELVANRASVHFQLTEGKFFAMTFRGQIVEVSETRAGLLKEIQGRKFPEEIFVWRIGYNAFSGRT